MKDRIEGWMVEHGEGAARWAVDLVAIVAALVLVSHCVGCGMSATEAARHGLAGTARVSATIDRGLAAERIRVSEEIRERAEATREDHDEAMRPFDEALEITTDVRDAHLAAEDALDAVEHGEAREWRPLITCVLSGLSRLVGIAARRIELPPDVGEVIHLLSSLAQGACPEPEEGTDR